MKKGNIVMGNRPSSGSENSESNQLNAPNQFQKPNDNDTIEMVAEQLAGLLLDYLQFKRPSGFKKLQRKG